MTKPTVTLPRENEIRAAFHKRFGPLANYQSYEGSWFIEGYLAALDAPANHPCQMCKHYAPGDESNDGICLTSNCTDFNKFQALPPIVLTKVTK